PVGGALTQGSSGDHTWRYHLWSHLDALDVEFDFVGPHDDVYSLEDEDFGDHSYADPDFDPEHAARWDRSAQELAGETAEVAAEYAPHYLLLLAGTEDILSGDGAEHARSEEHTSELQSRFDLVCRLLLEKKKKEGNRAL